MILDAAGRVPASYGPTTAGRAEPDRTQNGLVGTLLATSATAYARFARDGTLLEGNARFLEICAPQVGASRLPDLVIDGQRLEMERLLAGGDPQVETRNLHVGTGAMHPTTLLATWAWDGDELVLVGEPPYSDMEAAQATLVKLNSRVSDLARENAKKSAQLERALADLRQAQTMLVHREKMAALGQMTAGVAHEINNPLAYVRNNLFLVGEAIDGCLSLVNLMGDGLEAIERAEPELFEAIMDKIEEIDLPRLLERLPEMLTSTDEGVDRATHLVDSLRTFSRLDEADRKPVDVNDSMRSVVEFVGFLLAETGSTLTTDFGELPPVTCAPGQLNQAVLNLLTNAIQSSAPGGVIVLRTSRSDTDALISVTDNGPGVAPAIRDRIFEPFFTTRPVGEGTGLGLSIAHTVIEAHGGRIVYEDAPGSGARFTIHVPLDPDGPA